MKKTEKLLAAVDLIFNDVADMGSKSPDQSVH